MYQRGIHCPAVGQCQLETPRPVRFSCIGYISSGDSGEDYDPGEGGSGTVTARRPRSMASGEAFPEQNGKQVEKGRNVGKVSRPGKTT
jgi:hypothetical protein